MQDTAAFVALRLAQAPHIPVRGIDEDQGVGIRAGAAPERSVTAGGVTHKDQPARAPRTLRVCPSFDDNSRWSIACATPVRTLGACLSNPRGLLRQAPR